jgi:hypothetical protein
LYVKHFSKTACHCIHFYIHRISPTGIKRGTEARRTLAPVRKGATNAPRSAAKFLFHRGSPRSKLGTDSVSGRSTMSGLGYSPAMIRDVWEKEAKQRWDGQRHGRGLCLLIIDVLGPQGAFRPGQTRVAAPKTRILARPKQDPRTFHRRRCWQRRSGRQTRQIRASGAELKVRPASPCLTSKLFQIQSRYREVACR